MVRSRHGARGQWNLVFLDNARLGIKLTDNTRLVTGEPNVALIVRGRIVKCQQLLRQLVLRNDNPGGFAVGARLS